MDRGGVVSTRQHARSYVSLFARVRSGDAAALSDLAVRTYIHAFGNAFSEEDLASHLNNNLSIDRFIGYLSRDVILVAGQDGRPVGFAQFGGHIPGEGDGSKQELRRLYMDCDFQRLGIGSALMEAVLDHPRIDDTESICLDVWEHNHAAQRLYRRFAFGAIGVRTLSGIRCGDQFGYHNVSEKTWQSLT